MKRYLFTIMVVLLLTTAAGAQPVHWTQAHDALHPFIRAGSGVLGNYFYCFGGENGYWAQAFNLTTGQWEESTYPPFGNDNFASVATNDAIYLIGRYNGSLGNEVQKFTPIGGGPTGTWTQMAPYPFPVSQVTAAWDGGNYIYAAGGGSSSAYRYDISTNIWWQIVSMPTVRGCAGGAFVLGRFYVVGGSPYNNVVYEYNPDSYSWSTKAPLPQPVCLATFSVTFNDSLIFSVGGGGNYQYGSQYFPATNAVQVYHPLTDIWTQATQLPAVRGTNSARFIPPDKIISAGGLDSSVYPGYVNYSGVTYMASGFPGSVAQPPSTITMTPVNPPIQIPATGGNFDFNVTITSANILPAPLFNAWIMCRWPDQTWYGPLLGPVSLLFNGSTISRLRTQSMPATAPTGEYWYEARVGNFPNNAWDSSGFAFTKLPTGDGPLVSHWSCTGDPFPGEEAVTSQPTAFSLLGANPNPFNPTTAISFKLQAASHVSLKVYDTAGRLVATLVDGWREAGSHEVTFDGTRLASGLYLAKLTAGSFTSTQKLVLMK